MKDPKKDLEAIYRAGCRAVDPEVAVHRAVQIQGNTMLLEDLELDLDRFRRLLVIGAGKGSAPMAKALESILGDRISDGVIVVKYGHGLSLSKVRVVEAGHPVPDEAGLHGTGQMLHLAAQADESDLIFVVLSGGGSALMPAPVPPLTLEDKQRTTTVLLGCGATIEEVNAVRKHLSRIKGGGLARAAAPARVVSLILSDVIGDPLDAIASGPTAPDPTTYADCLEIVDRYGIRDKIPEPVLKVLEEGTAGKRPETPKPGDPVFESVHHAIVGNNMEALLAAEKEARNRGYHPIVLTSRVEGEAREVAKVITSVAKEVAATGHPVPPPACLLFGGEPTVTLRGTGKGGRNQELALAAALALDGWKNIALLSAGTDGTDGPTDAAGAFADGGTVERARALGLDPRRHLQTNDAYPFFRRLDDLLLTGPTRTNVMDLICVVIS